MTISRSTLASPGQRGARSDAADPPLRVRERAVLLGEARRGEDDVRVLPRRVVQEDVLRHQEVEPLQALLDVVGVRLGLRGVLADEVERLDAPVVEAGDDLVEAVAGPRGHLGAPRIRELPPDLRIVDGLVAGEVGRVRARVVQPLDVVLATERVQPGRLVAEMPGHEHEVRERPDVVDAARVLGDPEGVEDARVPLARVLAGGGADVLGGDAGDLLRVLGRVAHHDLAHRLEVFGRLADVLLVLEPLLEDRVHHRVQQPHVRPRAELEVALRELRQPDLARVGDDERRALAHGLLDPQRQHRVRLGRVRADDEQEAVVLDLRDGVGARASAERPDQAVEGGSVSGRLAGVDGVRPDSRARELLDEVVLLVGQPRRREEADRL